MATDQSTTPVVVNLVIAAIIVVVFWLLLSRLRTSVSAGRRARWEREETAYREQVEGGDDDRQGDAGGA